MKTSTAARHVRVLLADDHPLLLNGFAGALAHYGINVVGQTVSALEAVEQFKRLRPDVLVLDIRFGDRMTGLQAATAVLEQHPDARIIFLSQFDDDTLVREGYRLGARAFITKDCDPKELAAAIKKVNDGEIYFLPRIAQRLANMAIRGETSPRALLDDRQLDVFVHMARGCTNVEIAEALQLSPKTISNVSQTIKLSLGVSRQADLTRLAVKHGLLEP